MGFAGEEGGTAAVVWKPPSSPVGCDRERWWELQSNSVLLGEERETLVKVSFVWHVSLALG